MENEFEYIAGSIENELEYTKEVKMACKIGRVWYNSMIESGWPEEYALSIGLTAIYKTVGWDVPYGDFGGEIGGQGS